MNHYHHSRQVKVEGLFHSLVGEISRMFVPLLLTTQVCAVTSQNGGTDYSDELPQRPIPAVQISGLQAYKWQKTPTADPQSGGLGRRLVAVAYPIRPLKHFPQRLISQKASQERSSQLA